MEVIALEGRIRAGRARGEPVSAADNDAVDELMANALSRRLREARPENVFEPLDGYRFVPNDRFGARGDIINKEKEHVMTLRVVLK